jgi:NADH:ubiquinone oxidoreductase subunit 6 (subunit J)
MKLAAVILVAVGTVGLIFMFVVMRLKLERLRQMKDGRK